MGTVGLRVDVRERIEGLEGVQRLLPRLGIAVHFGQHLVGHNYAGHNYVGHSYIEHEVWEHIEFYLWRLIDYGPRLSEQWLDRP